MTVQLLCSWCGKKIDAGKLIRCNRCGSIHHGNCWKAYGKCSVVGCDGKPVSPWRLKAMFAGSAVLLILSISFVSFWIATHAGKEKIDEGELDEALQKMAVKRLADKHNRTLHELRDMTTAVEAYAADHSEYPNDISQETLNSYIRIPRADPWGSPYIYRKTEQFVYEILSAGQDQLPDTKDDYVFKSGSLSKSPLIQELKPEVLPGMQNKR